MQVWRLLAKQAKEAKNKESAAAKKPDLAPSKPDSRPSSNEPTPHSSPNILHQKTTDSEIDEDVPQKRNEFFQKKKGKTASKSKEPSSQAAAKKGKQARESELTGKAKDTEHLDYSAPAKKVDTDGTNDEYDMDSVRRDTHNFYQENIEFVGKLKDEPPELDEGEAVGESSDEENETNTTNEVVAGGLVTQRRGRQQQTQPEQELEEYMDCENKEKLLAIYDKYLENHSLRPILLKNLASFFEALPEKDRDKAAQSFPDFMPVDDSKPVYRIKANLAEQLAQIVHLFEPVKVNKFFSRLALILSSDRVSGVRIMGVNLLAKVIGVLIQEEWTDYSNRHLTHPDVEFLPLSNQIIHEIRRTFWTIGNWQQRQSFGRLLATLLHKNLIDYEQFCFLFGEDVMRISEDEVPNVRQCFCALGQITSSSDFFRATHEGISAAIRDKLQEFVVHDSDAEIRYQAQIALEQAELQNKIGETVEEIKNLALS
ncbi:serine/threonine-protein phosphatase 4 regulatory subunit 1 [Ditylenchus destructor]|nr:serine/threonine-protein phosphatase 4 regulatory subunit 1 [Ditylenchus destructor]